MKKVKRPENGGTRARTECSVRTEVRSEQTECRVSADFVGRGGLGEEGRKSHLFVFKWKSLENLFKTDRKDSVKECIC